MRKLLFVINPISGGISKTGLEKEIKTFCKDKADFTFIETTGEKDQQRISDKIESYKPSDVIACGGDGTVNLVAELLLGKSINLGILPLGSANGLATELNIEEDIEEAIEIIINNVSKAIDTLLINDVHYCLHLSDIGLNAKLIKRFSNGSQRGKLGYARHFFETMFKKKPKHYTFQFDEWSAEYSAEMVVFANAKKYGTGAIVNPDGKMDDGKFEVCIFKPYPWYALFRLTYLFFSGKLNYSPFVKIYSTREVELKCDSPEHLQIDGELMGKHKHVSVKVIEKKLKVLVPSPK